MAKSGQFPKGMQKPVREMLARGGNLSLGARSPSAKGIAKKDLKSRPALGND